MKPRSDVVIRRFLAGESIGEIVFRYQLLRHDEVEAMIRRELNSPDRKLRLFAARVSVPPTSLLAGAPRTAPGRRGGGSRRGTDSHLSTANSNTITRSSRALGRKGKR